MHHPEPPLPGPGILDQLRDVLAFVLDIDGAAVRPDTMLCELPDWSSLTFAVLLVGIRKRFGIELEPEPALGACTAGGLADLIATRLARPSGDP